ncbi:serine/threonine-protein kinase [Rhodococcus marinonascens]|uniref:serine/threonine-protein kinase n=1 Tax=Rhodococcus marinonascens TaxID=38311 RepID=UPI000934618E|nr:serine/threonine-protein kinase [Rhodococcus marinonascens]
MTRRIRSGKNESDSAERTGGAPTSVHGSSDPALAVSPNHTVSNADRTVLAPTVNTEQTATISTEQTAAAGPTATARQQDTLVTKPPSADLDDVEVGQQVDDFDLLMGLGSGAFGRVFLARQRSMQRLVAVKISRDHGNEPQTLARLDHNYIVRVFDQRLLEDRKLRLLYMQYLPGGTLLRVLRRVRVTPERERTGSLLLDVIDEEMREKGEIRPTDSSVRDEIASLTWPETIAWLGRRLAEALGYAGKRGVLHRDIKPANILLTAEGVPKLADFNISFSDTVAGASPLAYFGGSLAYMSPEQLEACHREKPGTAADLDTRSDIFALGVMLWELMCGRRPYDDDEVPGESLASLEAMIDRRSRDIDAEFLDQLPDDCPASLRRVLLKCLSPKPADRWSSGTELAQQFDLCLNTRARDLVDPPPNSTRMRLRRWALPILVAGIAVPNALAGAYNYNLNKILIISALTPEAQHSFGNIQMVINSIAFPLGAIVLLYWCRYPLVVPWGLRKGRTYDRHLLARARSDTLLLGDRVVLVVFGLWLVAGVAYPISLQLAAGNVPPGAYVHFIASLIVCGAMSVAYPFFVVAFFAVRYIYPALLPQDIASSADAHKLRGLDRRSTFYLALAASVPLAGVAGVTFLSPDEITLVIIAVRILCVGSIFAFIGIFWLFRQFEKDLRALELAVSHKPAH